MGCDCKKSDCANSNCSCKLKKKPCTKDCRCKGDKKYCKRKRQRNDLSDRNESSSSSSSYEVKIIQNRSRINKKQRQSR